MKRSKKGVSKRKDAKIKSKSRYGSRSKIKRVKSKKIKGGGIDDCQHNREYEERLKKWFTSECKTNINVNDIELELKINFKKLHKDADAGYSAQEIRDVAKSSERIKSLKYEDALNHYKGLLENYIKTKITSLDRTKMELFKDEWNIRNLEAEITEDGESILGNLFKKDTDYLKFTGKKQNKGSKNEHTIKLKGPNFNKEIETILAEINTKPAALPITTDHKGNPIVEI